MKIEIGQLDHSTNKFYAKVIERSSESDGNKITISPGFEIEEQARQWVVNYLSTD